MDHQRSNFTNIPIDKNAVAATWGQQRGGGGRMCHFLSGPMFLPGVSLQGGGRQTDTCQNITIPYGR